MRNPVQNPAASLVALLALVSPAAAQCPTASIPAPAGALGFGASFAAPDGRVLVGASATMGASGQPGVGAAYLCEWTGHGFAVTEELHSPTPMLYGFFGAQLALAGDEAIVTAPGEFTGRAHVFRRVGSGWLAVQQLVPADAEPLAGFGCSLDVDGDRMVIGAWGQGGAGAAYVYERQPGGGWSETARLDPSGPYQNLVFGEHASVSGDRILVSARQSGPSLPGTGAVYLYELGPSGWEQRQRAVGSDCGPDDAFGFAARLEGDVAIVGAVQHQHDGKQGSLYVFDVKSGLLVETQELVAPYASTASYGLSPDLAADRLAVGAITNTYLGGENYVQLFRHVGGAWVDDGVLQGVPKSGFGSALQWTEHGLAIGVSGTAGVGAPDDRVQLLVLDGKATLLAGPGEASASAGATQAMLLAACPSQAGTAYVVAGSIHGTAPTPVGGVDVPLALDGYTLTTLTQPAAVMTNGVGTLGADGHATIDLHLPPLLLPEFVGLELHHAAILFDAGGPLAASGATRLVLLP